MIPAVTRETFFEKLGTTKKWVPFGMMAMGSNTIDAKAGDDI